MEKYGISGGKKTGSSRKHLERRRTSRCAIRGGIRDRSVGKAVKTNHRYERCERAVPSYINYTRSGEEQRVGRAESTVATRGDASSSSSSWFSIRLAPSPAMSACKLINDRSRPTRERRERTHTHI